MKAMKKIIAAVLALQMLIIITGCGVSENTSREVVQKDPSKHNTYNDERFLQAALAREMLDSLEDSTKSETITTNTNIEKG